MAEDTQGASPKNEQAHAEANEDAETRAARRELKQSSISDAPTDKTDDSDSAAKPETPAADAADAPNAGLKDHVASPKKKRARDQLDGDEKIADDDVVSVASTDSAKDRASRLEPEKKRHRDGEAGDSTSVRPNLLLSSLWRATVNAYVVQKPSPLDAQPGAPAAGTGAGSPSKKTAEASANAFAASGFGKLAAGTSAFAALGAGQGSAFGAASKSTYSSLASPSQTPASQPAKGTAAPKLTFGANGGSSPFAGLSTTSNGFGGGLGGAFGSALSGAKPLFGFGTAAGKPLQSGKAPRPFGAPDSDSDSAGDEDEGEEADDDGHGDEAQRATSPEKDVEDRKRLKLQKGKPQPPAAWRTLLEARRCRRSCADAIGVSVVEVDDGEAGEATVASVRAKMFSLDKETGWKERGAGMLKINVPRSCVDFDENGVLVPGSFDASGLDADDEADGDAKGHRVVRLLMRQDQTHRVILNTAVVPAMQFQEKASLKSVGVLFTAFEGAEAKPVSVTMKVSCPSPLAPTFTLTECGRCRLLMHVSL